MPVSHQGTPVGEIAVSKPEREPLTAAEDRLLADLAAQAGPAFKNVRLDLELQARLEELQASRQRIVHAQDGARRRLERDLHDGAQQHLVALAVTARLARQLVDQDPRRAAALLDDLADQATGALAALRDLARGVFPAVLADRGLAAALAAHVARTCPGTRLESDARLAGARFPPAVEAGVYFCCLEALQNAAKHAPGARRHAAPERGGRVAWSSPCATRARGSTRSRTAPPTPDGAGAGLLNMADRMAALGGTLSIVTAPGRGTTVTGRAPLPPGPAPEFGGPRGGPRGRVGRPGARRTDACPHDPPAGGYDPGVRARTPADCGASTLSPAAPRADDGGAPGLRAEAGAGGADEGGHSPYRPRRPMAARAAPGLRWPGELSRSQVEPKGAPR